MTYMENMKDENTFSMSYHVKITGYNTIHWLQNNTIQYNADPLKQIRKARLYSLLGFLKTLTIASAQRGTWQISFVAFTVALA